MVTFDGSRGEGGGQILTTVVMSENVDALDSKHSVSAGT